MNVSAIEPQEPTAVEFGGDASLWRATELMTNAKFDVATGEIG